MLLRPSRTTCLAVGWILCGVAADTTSISPARLATVQTPTERMGAVRGRVINALSRQPLHGVIVRIVPVGDGSGERWRPWDLQGTPSARTGADGRFHIPSVPPGTHRVVVLEAPGYTVLGPTSTKALLIDVAAGVTRSGVDVGLQPQAVVSGRVLDHEGVGLPGVEIEIRRVGYRPAGRMLVSGGRGQTDADGEFRVEGVIPGRLYVRAFHRPSTRTRDPDGPVLSPTYFPHATRVEAARPVFAYPGQELGGVDIEMAVVETVRVSGVVVTAEETAPRPTAVVLHRPHVGLTNPYRVLIDADGGFRFEQVIPGRYVLTTMRDDETVAMQEVTLEEHTDDLAIILRRPVTLQGYFVRRDGRRQTVDLNGVRVAAVAWLADG